MEYSPALAPKMAAFLTYAASLHPRLPRAEVMAGVAELGKFLALLAAHPAEALSQWQRQWLLLRSCLHFSLGSSTCW